MTGGPYVHLAGDAREALLVCEREECATVDEDRVHRVWFEVLPPGASPEYAVHRANTHRAEHPGDER